MAAEYVCPVAWVWILALPLASLRSWAKYLLSLCLSFFISNMEILGVSASLGYGRGERISHNRPLKSIS